MYAVTNETTDQSDYSKTDCYKCWNVNKLCLPKIDADKKTEPLCKCGDGYEQDFDGNCMEVEEETEYIVENCPKDAQQSSSMCENNLHYELFEPKMSRNGNKLDTNQFSIKRNYFNVGQGDDGKPSTSTKEVSLTILLKNWLKKFDSKKFWSQKFDSKKSLIKKVWFKNL